MLGRSFGAEVIGLANFGNQFADQKTRVAIAQAVVLETAIESLLRLFVDRWNDAGFDEIPIIGGSLCCGSNC